MLKSLGIGLEFAMPQRPTTTPLQQPLTRFLQHSLAGALPNPPAASDSAAPGALSTVQSSGPAASDSAAPVPRDQQNDGSLNAAASGATSYYVPGPVNPDLRGQGRGEGGGDEGLTDFWIKGPRREWRQRSLGRGWPSGGPLGS